MTKFSLAFGRVWTAKFLFLCNNLYYGSKLNLTIASLQSVVSQTSWFLSFNILFFPGVSIFEPFNLP